MNKCKANIIYGKIATSLILPQQYVLEIWVYNWEEKRLELEVMATNRSLKTLQRYNRRYCRRLESRGEAYTYRYKEYKH